MGNLNGGGNTPTTTSTTSTPSSTNVGLPDPNDYFNSLGNGGTTQQASSGWEAWYGGYGGSVPIKGQLGLVGQDQHNANFYEFWQNAGIRKQLVDFGLRFGIDKADRQSLQQMWNMAGKESAALYRAGKKLTPLQVLAFYAGKAGAGGPGGGGMGSTSRSSSVSYDISDAKTAKAITNAVMNSALGREATAAELEAYKAALNSYEKANPSRSSGVSRSDGSGNSTSSSTSYSGASGAGREQLLKDKAGETTEGQAYQTQDVFQKAMERLAGMIG